MKLIPITHSLMGIRHPFARISILLFLFCCFLSATTFATTIDVCIGAAPTVPECAASFLEHNTGGSWSSSNPTVGTVDPSTGAFTPLSPGTTTISYSGGTFCGTFSFDVTVHALPSATIEGPSSVCVGSSISLSASASEGIAAGTWSSSSTGVATVSPSSGTTTVVTGVATGTSMISYTVSDSYGCTYVATKVVTVNALPDATISGPSRVCMNNTITLTAATGGGTWSSTVPSVGTVSPVGSYSAAVTGITAGTTTISYSVTDGNGCNSSGSKIITVDSLPDPGTVAGATICQNASTTLTVVGGSGLPGNWTSSNPSLATVGSATGFVQGVAVPANTGGTVTITYTVTNGLGCTAFTTAVVTVNPAPGPIIGSSFVVNSGNTITLSNAVPLGTWSSSDPSKATVSAITADLDSASVTGVAAGTTIIDYTLSNGCYVTKQVTVVGPFDLTVCEIAPIAICDTVFSFCYGLQLRVTGMPDTTCTVTFSPTIAATPSWVVGPPVGRVFTFTGVPATGITTYTVTVTHGSYATKKVIKIYTACPGSYPCSIDSFSCKNCPAVPFKTIYTLDSTFTSAQISPDTARVYFVPGANREVFLKVSPKKGSVFFTTCDVRIGIKDSIVIDSCHFFRSPYGLTAPGGFTVYPENSGKLQIINSSLIEGYDSAVRVQSFNPSTAPSPGSYVLKVDGAIFNHNDVDIRLAETNTPSAYSIQNSVFANRVFCNYKDSAGAADCDIRHTYPFVWPNVDTLRLVTDSTQVCTRYRIHQFDSLGAGSTGILLRGVGTTTVTGSSYNDIVIGDSSNEKRFNLFDKTNTREGIWASESNVILYNNVFQETFGTGGSGLVVKTSTNHNRVVLNKGSKPKTHNRFYNCKTGVNCSACFTLSSEYTELAFQKVFSGATINGYSIAAIDTFDYYNIGYNTINRLEVGISAGSIRNGNMFVHDNTITGKIATSGYTTAGISVSGINTVTPTGKIYVAGNNISACATAILLSPGRKAASANNNTISMSALFGDLKGIASQSNGGNKRFDSICYNHIYGNGLTVTYNTPANVSCGFDMWDLGTSTDTTHITCNYVHDIPFGFLFRGTSTLDWSKNVMARDKIGLRLGATIGEQGTSCKPSDNVWAVTSGWPGWSGGGGIAATSVAVSLTTSKLYVRSGASYTPPTNIADAGYTAYASGTTLLSASPCDSADSCSVFFTGGYYTASRFAPSGEAPTIPGITTTQSDATTYTIFPNPAEDNISIQSSINSDAYVQVIIRNYAAQVVYNGKQKLKNGLANIKLPNAAAGMYMVTITDEKGQSHQFKLVMQGSSINTNRVGN